MLWVLQHVVWKRQNVPHSKNSIKTNGIVKTIPFLVDPPFVPMYNGHMFERKEKV